MSNRRLLLSLNNDGSSDTHLWKDVDRIWFRSRGIFSVVFTFDINDNVYVRDDGGNVFGDINDNILKWDSITMAVGLCSTSDISSCVKYQYTQWNPTNTYGLGFKVSSGSSKGGTAQRYDVEYPSWPNIMYYNYIDHKYFCLAFRADGSNSMVTTLTPIFINVPKVEDTVISRTYHLAYDTITKKCYYIDQYDNILGIPNVGLEYKNNEFYVN